MGDFTSDDVAKVIASDCYRATVVSMAYHWEGLTRRPMMRAGYTSEIPPTCAVPTTQAMLVRHSLTGGVGSREAAPRPRDSCHGSKDSSSVADECARN